MAFSAFVVFDPPGRQRRVKPSCRPSMPLAHVQSLLKIRSDSVEATPCCLNALTSRCCHQRLSFASSASSRPVSTKCQRTPLRESLQVPSALRPGVSSRTSSAPGKPITDSSQTPINHSAIQHSRLYILSVGYTVFTRQAEQGHRELPSARGLQVQDNVVTAGDIRSSMSKRVAPFSDESRQAKTNRRGAVRALMK